MKKVTVIIPNYNGLKYMEPCLAALNRQTTHDFDVLVVDNGSSDGSVEWLKERNIPTIFLEKNLGFSGGVNVGIQAAKTPYVLLLNNDTEIHEDCISQLLCSIERSPSIFSVSGKMIQLHNRKLMDDAGDMYTVMGWAYQRGVGRSSVKYNREQEVFSACAAAAIYRRAVFDEIGLFDENHFAYLEDIDVGYRAKIAGYHNRYCPNALVYHAGSATSGSKYNSFKVRLAARNNIYLNYKNMPIPQMVINGLPLLLGIGVKYAFFKKKGFGKDYLDGFWEGIKTVKNCRKVPFKREHLVNYLSIQWELMAGTAVYVWEFLARQREKAAALDKNTVESQKF